MYLGVPKSVCYLPTAAASWCTEGLRLPHTMRMACPAVPEAACWVVSHKPEPREGSRQKLQAKQLSNSMLESIVTMLLESLPVDSAMALAPSLGVQSKSGGLWD